MKHSIPILLFLLLSGLASATAQAACSTNLVEADLVTTVTVTAGAGDNCAWDDENPHNALLVSVAGLVVPALGVPVNASFTAGAIHLGDDNYAEVFTAECGNNVLVCIDFTQGSISQPHNGVLLRFCVVDNRTNSISATATCVFQRLI